VEAGDGNGRRDRDRTWTAALCAGLAAVAIVAAYCWASRAGSDLTWDEAFNLRIYSRHPLTAVALYDEHNNHPLESFLKSLFVWTLGDHPPMRRITGLLFVAAHLAIAASLFRRMFQAGAVLAATVLVLVMLLARGISYQAMELRGYFLSNVLQFAWLFLLSRETGLFGGPPTVAWTRRVAIRYGILAALIAFTLPSNVLVLPALWVLTVEAFRDPDARGLGTDFRRGAQLALASVAFTALAYLPIAAAQLLGLSRFHNSEARPVSDVLAAAANEIGLAVRQLAPRGVPEAAFGWILLGVAVAAAVAALRPGGRLARLGLLVAAVALFTRTAFAAFVAYPERARTAQVAPLAIALVLAVHGLAAGLGRRVQLFLASAVLVATATFALPELVAEAGPYRVPSQIAAFLETTCRPDSRAVLVVHDGLRDPLEAVGRTFGAASVVSGQRELDARLAGETPEGRLAEGTWRARLRDWLFPRRPLPPLDPSKVDVLVLIDDETRPPGATQWRHPAIERLEARLGRRADFRRAGFRIVIFDGVR
jgi:hypothetical protein